MMGTKLVGTVGSHKQLRAVLSAVNKYDYETSLNKPRINGVELIGDKKGKDLLLQDLLRPVSNSEIEDMFR